jgi:hypothetical protein
MRKSSFAGLKLQTTYDAPAKDLLRQGSACAAAGAARQSRTTTQSVTASAARMPSAFLPATLQNETDLAASGLHDIKVRIMPKLKETERIVLAIER